MWLSAFTTVVPKGKAAMSFPGTSAPPRHMPPLPSGQPPDPGGTDSVTRAHRRQQQVAQAYQQYRASIPDGVSADELRDSAGMFGVTGHALTLGPALDAVRADRDAAQQRVTDTVGNVTVGDDQQQAATRIWARARHRVDAAKSVAEKVTAAQAMIAGAEGLTLAVYREELPDYLEDEGVPTDSWLDAAFAARVPGGSEAVAAATKLERAHAVLLKNHQSLTKAIARDTDPPPLLDPSRLSG